MKGSVSQSLPAPTGGWNTRDNIEEMPISDAVKMVNFIPRNGYVELRGGSALYADSMGSSPVKTLHEHNDTTGTIKLLAFTQGQVYDISATGAGISLGSGHSTDVWSTTMIDGTSILVNGIDSPQKYTVAGSLSATSFTGVGLADDNAFIHVNTFRGRLYFVEKNTANIWYGDDGAITGTVIKFPVGKIFAKGGQCLFTATWTRETGSESDDLLVIGSTNGELLMYAGADPGASDWSLVGKASVGRFLGNRAYFKNGVDLVVITENGCIPLPEVIRIGESSEYVNLSNKINTEFNRAGTEFYGNFGWQGLLYNNGQIGIINVPYSDTIYKQYVFNPLNQNWCSFEGWNGTCFCTYNGSLYFGGTDGKVYQADTGTKDLTEPINGICHLAYSYFGDKEQNKRFLEIAPTISLDNNITLNLGVDCDQRENYQKSTVYIYVSSGATWDVDSWNVSEWNSGLQYRKNNYGIRGYGRQGSIRLDGNFQNTKLRIYGFQVLLEYGGLR